MSLRLALAFTLCFLTFLSSLMLGLGQSDSFLPIIMGLGGIASFILTDYRRTIQLGDWVVNVFIILIVFCTIGEVITHRGEDLAWSIARVLVFVQVVLLFREKEPRFCWQILLISQLQVIIATIFQQSIFFACLLLLYVFVGLAAFILLFLQQEHSYFRRHSFVKNLVETFKSEMAERHDRGKLVRIALMTLLMGPLSLVLSFNKKKELEKTTDQKMSPKEILRSLFLVFPTEEDLARSERWESINESPIEEQPRSEPVSSFHIVPNYSGIINPAFTFSRFPLLTEKPSFSAGTRNPRPWNGNWRELLGHLTKGTFFAFFVAVILFCLIPRVGKIEFYEFTLKPGYENWIRGSNRAVTVGTVGIHEEIQLGSLGSVIPHHREVINIRFLHRADNKLLTDTAGTENPYREIVGATLYLRGTPLDVYTAGSWTQRVSMNSDEWLFRGWQPPEENGLRRDQDLFQMLRIAATIPVFDVLRMGGILQPKDQHRIFFEKNADLVTLAMEIQALDSRVFFAPHPFFCLDKKEELMLRSANGRIEEQQPRRFEAEKTIVTAAFKHGTQLDITPCQEWVKTEELLQIPQEGLAGLKALAAQWDADSRLPKTDIIGRARFLEQKFLHTKAFSYQLGGTVRNYDLDPLEDFVTNNPKGHCEYFAGALALMLRSVGIGSRIILGFKTDVNDYGASCSVRQSDAHAWVEVYVPPEVIPDRTGSQYAVWWKNGGWLRLDPTPPSSRSEIFNAISFRWTDLNHRIQLFWNEFVLNMNPTKQMKWVYQPIYQAGHFVVYRVFNLEFWRHLYFDMMRYYKSFFSDAPRHQRRMWDGFYLIPPFVILGLIFLAGWRLTSMLITLIRKRTTEEMRRRITIEFYLRMERMLARIGQVRQPAFTPLEFVRQSRFSPLTLPVVEAFYRVRFGNAVLTEEETKYVLKTLDQLEKSISDNESK